MTSRSWLLAAAVLGIVWQPARIAAQDTFRSDISSGKIGEQIDGYLGATGPVSKETQARLDSVNAKRREAYSAVASRDGISVIDAGILVACANFSKPPILSNSYRLSDGVWRTRGSEAIPRPQECYPAGSRLAVVSRKTSPAAEVDEDDEAPEPDPIASALLGIIRKQGQSAQAQRTPPVTQRRYQNPAQSQVVRDNTYSQSSNNYGSSQGSIAPTQAQSGADAKQCPAIKRDGNTTWMVNTCSYPIEAVWCSNANGSCSRYDSQHNMGLQSRYPVSSGQIVFAACRGYDSVRINGGFKYRCVPGRE
jgi:uncharacterized protein